MNLRIFSVRAWLPIITICALLAGACNFPLYPGATIKAPTPENLVGSNTFPVDPVFLDFYTSLGGEAVLGPAIAPLNEAGNLRTQYVANALLVYDPQSPASERYRLAPLGLMLGIAAPSVPDPGRPGEYYINGHLIYPEFQAAYESFGGAHIVGRPLTEARHDKERSRIDQYFENLGFYRLETDPPGTVRLAAYGAYHCNQLDCNYTVPFNAAPRLRPTLPEPFETQADRMGLIVTGRVIAGPLQAPDGRQEVIFENVVVVAEPSEPANLFVDFHFFLPAIFRRKLTEAPMRTAPGPEINMYLPLVVINSQHGQETRLALKLWLPLLTGGGAIVRPLVTLRPLPEDVGIAPQETTYRGSDPLMVFYPTEGERGFHIPILFDDFIRYHGGYETFGAPITEVFPLILGMYRQCFKFMCLDFDLTDPENPHLKLAALGLQYHHQTYDLEPQTVSAGGISIRVWEAEPFVSSDESQMIFALVFRDKSPLSGVELMLHLTRPDGTRQELPFPPTDKQGQTSLIVPAIDAPGSTLIAYEVCRLDAPADEPCAQDLYPIWNAPK